MAKGQPDRIADEPAFGATFTGRRDDRHGIGQEAHLGGYDGTSTADVRQGVDDEAALAHHGRDRGGRTWADEVARRRAETTDATRWSAIALAVVLAGPAAVIGAFVGTLVNGGGFTIGIVFAVVVIGPAIEEIVKIAGALHLVERRPWLVPSAWTLPAIALAAGLVFAAIENLIYLNVYIPDPSAEIARFRWIAGPLLHGSASLLAGIGVMRQFQAQQASHDARAIEDVGRTEAARWPWFVAAWVLHGGYNLVVTILSAAQVGVPTG